MRKYEDWEKCDRNMSGLHTWTIKTMHIRRGMPVKQYAACNRCGAEPPSPFKLGVLQQLLDYREIGQQQRHQSQTWRAATGR